MDWPIWKVIESSLHLFSYILYLLENDEFINFYCLISHKVEDLNMSTILKFLNSDRGATSIEYGLIIGLIAVVIITGVRSVGSNMSNQWLSVINGFKN